MKLRADGGWLWSRAAFVKVAEEQYVGGRDKVVHGPSRRRDLAWLKWCDVAGFWLFLAL